MNCIIVDDEPLARKELAALIKELATVDVVGEFSSARAAAIFMQHNTVPIVFLDIDMPMISGLDFAADLPRESLVIFTTAHPQYALKGYELDAVDYLLKPVDRLRLEKAVVKAMLYANMLSSDGKTNTIEAFTPDYLLIRADRRVYRIKSSEIRFVEGLKDYVVIFTRDRKLITAMNLKTIQSKLPQDRFLRVSKSYVVNTDFIESFDHNSIYLKDSEIPLGEVYRKDFFKNYTGGNFNQES
ncbi:MAG: response regulator transcription factor [Chryseobacterium sp.]|nr:MAG: response regulator transcription factor [Chryseobacterium sp.]